MVEVVVVVVLVTAVAAKVVGGKGVVVEGEVVKVAVVVEVDVEAEEEGREGGAGHFYKFLRPKQGGSQVLRHRPPSLRRRARLPHRYGCRRHRLPFGCLAQNASLE